MYIYSGCGFFRGFSSVSSLHNLHHDVWHNPLCFIDSHVYPATWTDNRLVRRWSALNNRDALSDHAFCIVLENIFSNWPIFCRLPSAGGWRGKIGDGPGRVHTRGRTPGAGRACPGLLVYTPYSRSKYFVCIMNHCSRWKAYTDRRSQYQ